MKKNQRHWDSTSDAYQARHGAALAEHPLAWGVWRTPESELRVLGEVAGLRVLELGCGAAQWTLGLIGRGARAAGVDLSARQLLHARRAAPAVPLVLGDAEVLPFRSESFDVVFCDHGATTFARPSLAVAEASRVLKRDGLLAFCMSTPIRDLCWDMVADRITAELANDYFSLSALDDGESVTYQLPYGAWIRLFREHSLSIEDLVEIQAPQGASTTYDDFVPAGWARRWPAEHIWKLRKDGPAAAR
ncbi:MAG TPA: class I SAM-dependent methyltransferase [Thermoanaerobaculia bacterium]|nr:class I SAM-dependent methyltransferase [Thermoanaerobaculia bacterium]